MAVILARLIVTGLVFLALPAMSAPNSSASKLLLKEAKLKNGLRVILVEDHSAPTCTICVTYDVGARDERAGRTGLAHLFEHMMFQGSENVGKGEHSLLILNNGGGLNGQTTYDRTMYADALPANQLELGLFLEADRMRSLSINQANLDNQRLAVKEERTRAVNNQPYGRSPEVLFEAMYDNFGYKHPLFGSMEDLDSATVQDVAEFFRVYYAPNNAVLTIVGDFEVDEALEKVRKYFESIPVQPLPPRPDRVEPEQKAERRRTIEDAFAHSSRVDIGFKTPPGNTPDWYALNVLMRVLTSGQSSRLYQKLVREREMAISVSGNLEERRGQSPLHIYFVIRPGKDAGEAERIVHQEIDRIKNEGINDWELQKARMQVRRQFALIAQSTYARAFRIGDYAIFYNDPGLINALPAKFERVTKEDVMRVARAYLTEANRSVIVTSPLRRMQTENSSRCGENG